MKDICNFIPDKGYVSGITYYHFVYQTNFQKLCQPFLYPHYRLHLVVKGFGNLKTKDAEYSLTVGSVFVTAPHLSFQLCGNDQFSYAYISFDGNNVIPLLGNHQITEKLHVFHGLGHTISFWMDSLRRFTPQNGNSITESVLMYTLSYLGSSQGQTQNTNPDKFSLILGFIQNHYQNKDLTLKSVASLFFYNEKYFSALFKQNTSMNFSKYLNGLRIRHAEELIASGISSMEALASSCGYSDPVYFSKVFKRVTGKTPTAYIKQRTK